MVRACVSVNKILCETIIGVYPDELYTPQKVEFGFSFEYNCEQAINSDSIENAVDYAKLTEDLKIFVSNSKFKLLETLTAKVAEKILVFSPQIISTKVYCKKIEALPGTDGPKIKIKMEKNEKHKLL